MPLCIHEIICRVLRCAKRHNQMTDSPRPPVTHVYRYRSAEAVLEKYEELEKQEIYFSRTNELNDPMEGFKDLFWRGDEIVWRALLKHYICCLLGMTYYALITGPDFDQAFVENLVFGTPEGLPAAPIREIYSALVKSFFDDAAVKAFLAAVVSRECPVRRNELIGYLRVLHPLIMTSVFNDLRMRGLWPEFVPPPESTQAQVRAAAIKLIETAVNLFKDRADAEKVLDGLFWAGEAQFEQVALLAQANVPDRAKKAPLLFLSGIFPRAYLSALDRVVFSDWYVACFSSRPDNHSMWSTYADGHRGVCLMFKVTPYEGDLVLNLNRVTGARGSTGGSTTPIRSFVPHPVRQVRYSKEYPAIDFFRSLGRFRQMDVTNFWYRGDDGRFSDCHDAVFADEAAWRKGYWAAFTDGVLYKTPEWAHEEEYRAIAFSAFDMSAKEDRKLQFRFEDLEGILFGARTTTDTKLKILDIVSRKCAKEGRTDFKFFEVRYTPDTSFKVFELSLFKAAASRASE
jgi:hypothetical protein